MNQKGNMAVNIIIAMIVVLAAGAGIYALTQDDNETTNTAENTQSTPAEPAPPAEEPAEDQENIVDLAVATPQLSILVAAVTEAGLDETLAEGGPYTVLAPSDDAFAATLEELEITQEELLARDDLTDILTYHVVSGSVLSSDLVDGQVVTTLQGGTLTVNITEDGVFFVDANDRRSQVVTTDVEASNGVVHIIDTVLLP